MQVVVLCGGMGSRMYPATKELPKPLIHIGDKPILWHIMNLYASHGHKEFILLIGYKGEEIKQYFSDKKNVGEDWKITFLDTGIETRKGDRLKMAKDLITGKSFLLAYGDDLSNVDINKVIDMHERNRKMVTLTSVRLTSNFGIVDMTPDGTVIQFREKPQLDQWINGGYLVVDKDVIGHIAPGKDETDAFAELAKEGKVQAYKHEGFWKTMNTIKDMEELNDLWNKGELQKHLNHNGHGSEGSR
jgi:glucose-1-phosphate cytidylyltransferase